MKIIPLGRCCRITNDMIKLNLKNKLLYLNGCGVIH